MAFPFILILCPDCGSQTRTPPALADDAESAPVDCYVAFYFDYFMMYSQDASRFFISCLTLTSVSVIYFVTAFRLLITTLISGTTSSLVFSTRTPLMSLQHLRPSSSLEMLSRTSSFSFFSSSISINFQTRTWASFYNYLYLPATFYSIYA